MDNNALDSSFEPCTMCPPWLQLCQSLRSGPRRKLYLTREPPENVIQRPQESKVQESGPVQRFRYEGLAIRALVRIFYRTGDYARLQRFFAALLIFMISLKTKLSGSSLIPM